MAVDYKVSLRLCCDEEWACVFENREYPHLNGREVIVVQRIEELCQSGLERHASLAVDNRASTHLQVCIERSSAHVLSDF